MGIRLCGISFLPLALGVLLGPPAAGQEKKQKPQNSIESLFEGLPADLRKNVKSNAVRQDRVNDWLKEHVNGKGKTIEVRVPVEIIPTRAKDGTYDVQITLVRSAPPAITVRTLGDEWPLELNGRAVLVPKKGKGKGLAGKGKLFRRNFSFVGISPADAEKLADLKVVTIQGKVEAAALLPMFGGVGISLALDDVRVEGKKLTPYEPAKDK
jgi:hypothetical protein